MNTQLIAQIRASTSHPTLIIGQHLAVIQSMLDFDYLCGKTPPDICGLITGSRGVSKLFWGKKERLFGTYRTVADYAQANPSQKIEWFVHVSSARRVKSDIERIFDIYPSIQGGVIFAEGLTEQHALSIYHTSIKHGALVVGPATVGFLVPGALKLGAIGGVDPAQWEKLNITTSGKVAVISGSGGMTGELIVVAFAKCATVMAVSGAVVLWHFAMASPEELMEYAKPVDSAATWDSVFSPQGLVRMVLLSWIIGPVIEELVFRGFLYHAWERQWGWFPSLLLTSACFGIAHPSHMASSFMGSVIYICIMRRTGTIVAPILLHVLFNVLVSWPVLGEVSSRIPHGTTTDLWSWWPWLASVAFVSIALPAYVWMARDGSRAASAFAVSSHS